MPRLIAPANQSHYFDQLIDHSNPSLGTFKQRYFFSQEFYGKPGSPIIVQNAGEQAVDKFWATLTGTSMMKGLMKELGAAGVVMEHRYWGESSPYPDLTTDHMKYLTLDQSIEDMKYFVENVQLPWSTAVPPTGPNNTPWIHLGCSYPGLLAAYIQQKYPKLFAAAWASSAPVQADLDFWEYYAPIEDGMPKNCSKDAGAVVSYIDDLLDTGSSLSINHLKKDFGMEATKDVDFVQSIASVFWNWQSLQPYSETVTGYDAFYKFCDALETLPNGTINQSSRGVGLSTALKNYATFFKNNSIPLDCPGGSCYSSFDYTSAQYTDLTVRNEWNRQWYWMICNEFAWWQTGDIGSGSLIISKHVTVPFNLRQCSHMFPKADGSLIPYKSNVKGINGKYKGWKLRGTHLFATNGEFDPWRSASLSSKFGPRSHDTASQKVVLIPGAHHCWDWSMRSADNNPRAKNVIEQGMHQLKTWLDEWYRENPQSKAR